MSEPRPSCLPPKCIGCKPSKVMRVWQVKKDNLNKGRWFFSCFDCDEFVWATDIPPQFPQPAQINTVQQNLSPGAPIASHNPAAGSTANLLTSNPVRPHTPAQTPAPSVPPPQAASQCPTPNNSVLHTPITSHSASNTPTSVHGVPSQTGATPVVPGHPRTTTFASPQQTGPQLNMQNITPKVEVTHLPQQVPTVPPHTHQAAQSAAGTFTMAARAVPQSFGAFLSPGASQLGVTSTSAALAPPRALPQSFGASPSPGASLLGAISTSATHALPGAVVGATPPKPEQTVNPAAGKPPVAPHLHGKGAKVLLSALNDIDFGLSTMGFDQVFVDVIKLLQRDTRSWDGGKRLWVCPLSCREEVVAHLQHHGFIVERVPKEIEDIIMGRNGRGVRRANDSAIEERFASLGPDLIDSLYPYQRAGVRLGLSLHGRLLLADEMGLGKTAQAMALMACYPEDWPLLIICPKSMRNNWTEALDRWLPQHLRVDQSNTWQINTGKELERMKAEAAPPSEKRQVCVISYALVKQMKDFGHRYKAIICDEAHSLKSGKAKQTQVVRDMVKRAKRAVLVTGTPMLSRPIELFEQINMLRPELLGSFFQFGDRYCTTAGKPKSPYGCMVDYQGSNNLPELNAVLGATVMVRRTKVEVMDNMPVKQRHRVVITPDPEYGEQLSEALMELNLARMRAEEMEASGEEWQQRRAFFKKQLALMEYFRASGPPKVKEAVAFVAKQLAQGEKVLCFAYHHNVLDAIEEQLCEQYKVQAVRIDGAMSDKQRSKAVADFQQDPRYRIALLSMMAAGQGITLTAAAKVVFVELYWNPCTLVQAEDRAHRIGQERNVDIFYLTCPKTSDDIVWPLVNRKFGTVGRVLDGTSDPQAMQAITQNFSSSATGWEADLERYIAENHTAAEEPEGTPGAARGSASKRRRAGTAEKGTSKGKGKGRSKKAKDSEDEEDDDEEEEQDGMEDGEEAEEDAPRAKRKLVF